MRVRSFLFGTLLVAAGLSAAQKNPLNLDGTYEVRTLYPGSKVAVAQDPRTTPPGQIQRVVISGKHWILFDMLTSFEGDVEQSRNRVVLVVTSGPTGPSAKPHERLTFSINRKGDVLTTEPNRQLKNPMVLVRTSRQLVLKYRRGGWTAE